MYAIKPATISSKVNDVQSFQFSSTNYLFITFGSVSYVAIGEKLSTFPKSIYFVVCGLKVYFFKYSK